MTTNPLDDHRGLAVHTVRLMVVLAGLVGIAVVAARRADALPGLAAGTAVGMADVYLLTRSLSRFDAAAGLNPRALGVGMFTRFLSVGALLGLVLCVRTLNPLAALVGFLLMPAAVAITGGRFNRARRGGALDAAG